MGQIDILPAGDRLLGLGIQNGYGADHKSSLTIPEIHEAGCLYFGARDHVTGGEISNCDQYVEEGLELGL